MAETRKTGGSMSHHLDHAVASDLSYRVLQARRDRNELTPPVLHLPYQRSEPCVFDGYIADRPSVPDSYQGDGFKRAVIVEG